jgi:hypothetical protein
MEDTPDSKKRKLMVETVQFDVGGKIFKVSRALIDEHPDTMLAKMISEAWENENDKDKPLFIDRDGDKFSYVLDYLRYGSIDLPHSIPKTMFQRELDYYGITAEDETVKAMPFLEFVKANDEELKRWNEQVRQYNEKVQHHKLIRDMLALAVKCHHKLFALGTVGESIDFPFQSKVCEQYNSYHRPNGKELLEKYLDEFFGLTAKLVYDGSCLRVSVKK